MGELTRAERVNLLAARPVFEGLPADALDELTDAMEVVNVKGGAPVVVRGQTHTPLLVVLHGGLRASFVDKDGSRHILFEYFRGGSVGEAMILSGQPCPLDLHAIRDSQLLRLTPEKFEGLVARYPEVALKLARVVSMRAIRVLSDPVLAAAFSRTRDRVPRSIALVSVGGEEVHRTTELLAQALSRARRAERFKADDSSEAVGSEAFSERLDACISEGRLVILECDLQNPSWMQSCLRQADRTMVVLDENERRPPTDGLAWWERAGLSELPSQLELAIVHRRKTEVPRDGTRWSAVAGVTRLHHITAERKDTERLARWLLDRPVGLVLGGGGAFGIAHVGVLKALEIARVPVDIVGGTSMGAIFAGGLARGWCADEIMDHVRRLFSSPLALYDFTIPFTALLAGKKLDRVMDDLYGDLSIADLWIPFFSVATNIARARQEVHDTGKLRDAIRASCSIPGLFPPFRRLTDLLVDGGLVDNLPLDVMSERCHGPVIAVDVFPYQRMNRTNDGKGKTVVARVAELLRRIKPSLEGGTPIADILVRATLSGSQHNVETARLRNPPSLYLTPDLSKFYVLGWREYEALYQAGYECAMAELEAGRLPRSLWEGPLEATN
jgi:predicted acylesterase/phospholipase RssA/CRP-like cAMP-binding protein